MSKRVCSVPGCPNLTAGGKCPGCRRAADRARGSRQARGYDAPHDRLRAAWQRRINAGERVVCWRPDCDRLIRPGDRWHLGHLDDRSGYGGPECEPCNTSHGGRAAHPSGSHGE